MLFGVGSEWFKKIINCVFYASIYNNQLSLIWGKQGRFKNENKLYPGFAETLS